MRRLEFANRALEAAGVGGWEMDVATGELYWTPLTFEIHEVEPGQLPALEEAINFYRPDARPVIAAAVAKAIDCGAPWDLELPFVTAKGRHIWVRACGSAVQENGRTVLLTGAFQDVTAKRAITEQLERLSVVAKQMTNAVIITDVHGRTEWLNDAFVRLTGYGLKDMRGRRPGELLQGPESDQATIQEIREKLGRREVFEVEIVNYTRSKEPYWISMTCTPLADEHGNHTGFIAVQSDVTARRQAEAEAKREMLERQRAEGILADVLEALPSAVAAFDADERLILTNQAYKEMFPICAGHSTAGLTLEQIVKFGVENGQYPDAGETQAARESWMRSYLSHQRSPGDAYTMMLPDNRYVLARERRSGTGNLVCIRSDTTDLKRIEAELRKIAERDGLTGLANRGAFMAALDKFVCSNNETSEQVGALILLDVDNFKTVNDTFGHDAGDALLVEIGNRLRSQTRAGDMPARLGGDEFIVLLPGLYERQHVVARIDAIQAALAEPMILGGSARRVTTSAGVALVPLDGATAEQVVKAADLALYDSKRAGRDRWSFRRN